MVRLVSLDTSSTKTGWALYENGILKESGLIDLTKSKDTELRLLNMCIEIKNLLALTLPQIVVCEMVVISNNTSTQRMLSEIVGAVRGYSLFLGAEFYEYRPTIWRKLIADKNEKIPIKRADCKTWAVNKVEKIYNKKCSDDEAESILIGLAHINYLKG